MFGLGVPEILVIAIIILLIFGAKRLPSIGEGLGKTVRELRNIKKDVSRGEKPEKKKAIEGGEPEASAAKEGSSEGDAPSSSASEDQPAEGDLVDAFQKKMTKKVTDKVLGQIPGIKQAKQLKNTADKIKKIVS